MNKEKEKLLSFCRYYRGEDKPPYRGRKDGYWAVERAWVRDMIDESESLSEATDTFIYSPVYEETKGSGVPLGILAYLYAYYGKHDEMGHTDGFLEYLRHYKE